MEELLTPQEVANLFKVSLQTVRRWSKKGALTAIVTPGGRIRYQPQQVYALISALETKATQQI